ncbi:MAG: pyridoxal-phosphate dependent enzyme [Bacteroidales bacterium]|jgi:threonine synthase|nr:pyridoxal-phosphate dependent enzyme [Bacteroidales bacterium]
MAKFILKCTACGKEFDGFKAWFEVKQICPSCKKNRVEAIYDTDYNALKDLIYTKNRSDFSFWHYFDFLPLNDKKNIVTTPELPLSLDRWMFLEDLAKEHFGIDCEVRAYRNDEHYATGTFKDNGASLAASVLKETDISEYIVASTGNVANSFAYYMAKAGVSLTAFIPQDALALNGAGVSCYGQKVFRVNDDYHQAKKVAAAYAEKYGILMTGGNVDPLRVEAKRTMVFEWLRDLKNFPTVYIQALSGGTGPIAIDKALREIEHLNLVEHYPRFLMVQPNGCSPMVQGWERAKANNFSAGWESNYPIFEAPVTQVPTLATGNPGTFPIIANLVKKSNGDMLEVQETKLVDMTRYIAYEAVVAMGPAAATAALGFVEALKTNNIKNGDFVLLNIGEGMRRAPELLLEMNYTEQRVNSVDECERFDRKKLRNELKNRILK